MPKARDTFSQVSFSLLCRRIQFTLYPCMSSAFDSCHGYALCQAKLPIPKGVHRFSTLLTLLWPYGSQTLPRCGLTDGGGLPPNRNDLSSPALFHALSRLSGCDIACERLSPGQLNLDKEHRTSIRPVRRLFGLSDKLQKKGQRSFTLGHAGLPLRENSTSSGEEPLKN